MKDVDCLSIRERASKSKTTRTQGVESSSATKTTLKKRWWRLIRKIYNRFRQVTTTWSLKEGHSILTTYKQFKFHKLTKRAEVFLETTLNLAFSNKLINTKIISPLFTKTPNQLVELFHQPMVVITHNETKSQAELLPIQCKTWRVLGITPPVALQYRASLKRLLPHRTWWFSHNVKQVNHITPPKTRAIHKIVVEHMALQSVRKDLWTTSHPVETNGSRICHHKSISLAMKMNIVVLGVLLWVLNGLIT